MTILIAEGMHQGGLDLLQRAGLKSLSLQDSYRPEEVQILVVRSVFQVDEKVLQTFPRLKAVAKLGTGLDNIDIEACRVQGVAVLNSPGLNSVSTAEFVVMQILNLCKNSFEIFEKVKNKDFRRGFYYGRELAGLTAGIIGYGSVGKNIVKRLSPFVQKIHVRDKNESGSVDLNRLLSESDILILAVPLVGNKEMLNNDLLAELKKNVLIVNMARGGLVQTSHLVSFLKENKSATYCCDVIDPEPDYLLAPEKQNYHHPLLELPNVVFTPHIAGMTRECQEKIATVVAEKIIKVMIHD